MVSVCFGGTFTLLHKGHEKLLKRAIELGDEIEIGVTSDGFAKSMGKPHDIRSYGERISPLLDYLETLDLSGKEVRTVELENRYGPALNKDYDYIVVSPETRPTAISINRMRLGEGRRPIKIALVPFVLADDFLPISVTRILDGEIGLDGELIGPFRAGICGFYDQDIEDAVRHELEKLSEKVELFRIEGSDRGDPVSTSVSRAMRALDGMTIGIGFGLSDLAFCAIVDRDGQVSMSMSPQPRESFIGAMEKKMRSLEEGRWR